MKFVSGAITAANRALLDAIELLWRDGHSMAEIGARLGGDISRSDISGLIARARKQPDGADRFPVRPKPESTRLSARRRRAIKAGLSPDAARVAIPNAGRTRAVRSLGAAATTVLETLEPDAADTEPQLGLPLWELEAGMCWFAVNEVPTGKGLDLRFCGRPVVRGRYCESCALRAYDPRGCRRTGKNFVVRDINKRP